tara:strand:+ start:34256 stop:36472 length:2217 start_codon:yes stop_codon:yes gene_type:complete
MRPTRALRGLLKTDQRKKKLEKDIDKTADLVKSNKNRVEYLSSLMKEITDYITYMDSVVVRFEGNFGLEENIVQAILKTLNELKRTVSMTMEILANVPEPISARIKKEIEDLNELIRKSFATTLRNERRVYKGRSPRTHLLEKAFGSIHRDVDIYREVKAAANEEGTEQEEEIRFRQEFESLRQGVLSGHGFKEYGEDAIRILRYYRREFEHLFKPLWDIQEEEARNISLLEHYIGLLGKLKKDKGFGRQRIEYELEELHEKLLAVETKLKRYIRRDYRVQLNLDNVFEEFENRFEKVENNLEGIEKEPLNFISGQIYSKKINGQYPKKGIVFVPGAARSYVQFETIIYRLVLEGYRVCAFDLPSQGSSGKWKLGLMSVYIYACVRYIRQKGVTEVGVMGHSTGAMAILYALAGYNEKLEQYIMDVATNYIDTLKFINDKIADELEELNKILEEEYKSGNIKLNARLELDKAISLFGNLKEEEKAYEEFKGQIVDALKTNRFGGRNVSGKIDVAVLLASPQSIQTTRSMPGFFRWKKTPLRVSQFTAGVFEGLDRFVDSWKKKHIAVNYNLELGLKREFEGFRWGLFEVEKSEWRDFVKYTETVPNPFNFMSLLEYFAEKYQIIKYIQNKYIKDVPKLFVYGTPDLIIGASVKDVMLGRTKRMESLEKAYGAMMGPTSELKVYPDQGHLLKSKEFMPGRRAYAFTSPKVYADVLAFLRKHLNPNVNLWREVPDAYKKF